MMCQAHATAKETWVTDRRGSERAEAELEGRPLQDIKNEILLALEFLPE